MNVYQGLFNSWADVQAAYEMNEPEPDEVLMAMYEQPPYEGYSYVLYRNGCHYFLVYGGHCSCYGLEGQWEPEEYDLPTLIRAVEKANEGYYGIGKDIVKILKDREE